MTICIWASHSFGKRGIYFIRLVIDVWSVEILLSTEDEWLGFFCATQNLIYKLLCCYSGCEV